MWCNETGCTQFMQISQLSTNITGLNYSRTYCTMYGEWTSVERRIHRIVNCSLIVCGLIGLIGYTFMLLIYRSKTFDGVSMVYHRAMAGMEVVHMIIMLQCGIVEMFDWPETFAYVTYRYRLISFWIFGDSLKLAIAVITAFLSFERAAAIWHSHLFSLINRRRLARFVVMGSMLIGVMHLGPAGIGTVAESPINSGRYRLIISPSEDILNRLCWRLLYAVRLLYGFAIIVCCSAIAIGLIRKAKRSIALGKFVKEKWVVTRRLCIMQLVMAITCLLHHGVWVTGGLLSTEGYRPNDDQFWKETDLHKRIESLKAKKVCAYLWLAETLTGELDHCFRFLLYLLCLKGFRDGFLSLVRLKR